MIWLIHFFPSGFPPFLPPKSQQHTTQIPQHIPQALPPKNLDNVRSWIEGSPLPLCFFGHFWKMQLLVSKLIICYSALQERIGWKSVSSPPPPIYRFKMVKDRFWLLLLHIKWSKSILTPTLSIFFEKSGENKNSSQGSAAMAPMF